MGLLELILLLIVLLVVLPTLGVKIPPVLGQILGIVAFAVLLFYLLRLL